MARRSKNEPVSQRTHRKFVRTRDQHGRVWEGVIEKETLHPVGALQLVVGEGNPRVVCEPPVQPPNNPRVLKFDEEEVGYFEIDYDVWLAQHDSEIQRWHNQLQSYAMQFYGDEFQRHLNDPPPSLLNLVGQKPAPREQIIACREGHPWALGRTAVRPSWANRVFPKPSRTPTEAHDDETAFLRADGSAEAMDEERRRERAEAVRRAARLEQAIGAGRDEDVDYEEPSIDEQIARRAAEGAAAGVSGSEGGGEGGEGGEGDEGDEEGDDGESEGGLGSDGSWPRHHAQTWWKLSDGSKVQGRTTARKAQRELDTMAAATTP